ncbi:hypothetical protein FDP41_009646 [Naegleria fowleri]|uniref:TauD/TfdA-like domain-containing protein n=1 Tax=Naegleria fowleri TaxID=5763 RepID=A0A6A5BCZ4_NAEFO|nr:uncharacterized protein FDP41_009646 [Naegleria fowleri]KAF0971950.1 hypothetical protein FDP41_009646 [Naegleria fowleri]
MPSCLGSCLCSTFTSFFGNNDGKSRIQYRKLYGTLGSITTTCPFTGKQQQQCGPLPFGREIFNVDISNGAKSLNDLEIIELRRALIEHHILLFRCSKPLSPTEQTQFCERLFGETARYPYPVNNQEMLWNQELDTYIPGHPDIWKIVSTDYTAANQRVLSKCALISSCPSSPQPSTNSSSSATQSIYNSPQKVSYPQSPQQYNMPCQQQQMQQTPYSPSLNMQSSPQYQHNYQQYGTSPYTTQQYNYASQQPQYQQQYNLHGNQSSLTPYYQAQQSPYSPLMKYEPSRSFSPISSSSQYQTTTTYNIDKPTFAAGNFFYWNCDGAYRHEICPTPVTVWNAALSNRDDEILFTDLQLAYERLEEAVKQKTSKVFSIIKGPSSSSVQPLVRKHPVTGKKGLYLHTGLLSGFLVSTDECNHSSTEQCPTEINNTINLPETKIKTMGCSCCKQLNQCLINHLDNGPVFRLKWKTGDIVVCDNMAVAFRGVYNPHIQQGQNTILYKTAIDTHDVFWLRDSELYKQCN